MCHIPPILPILQNHTNRRTCQTCQTCRSAARCQTGTPFGAAQSIPSRPKPGFRKEARLWAGKKARDEPTCVSHGIAPISPASRAAPGGRVPGVSDERPNLPKPKPRAPQSPCLQVPAIPSAGSPNLAEGALRKPRWPSTFLHMGWKSGQRFWRLERSEIKQKSVRHAYITNPTRIFWSVTLRDSMAIFYLDAAIISACTGTSAVRAAAYRHAVRMVSHAFHGNHVVYAQRAGHGACGNCPAGRRPGVGGERFRACRIRRRAAPGARRRAGAGFGYVRSGDAAGRHGAGIRAALERGRAWRNPAEQVSDPGAVCAQPHRGAAP